VEVAAAAADEPAAIWAPHRRRRCADGWARGIETDSDVDEEGNAVGGGGGAQAQARRSESQRASGHKTSSGIGGTGGEAKAALALEMMEDEFGNPLLTEEQAQRSVLRAAA
jgi:hypothetical protein